MTRSSFASVNISIHWKNVFISLVKNGHLPLSYSPGLFRGLGNQRDDFLLLMWVTVSKWQARIGFHIRGEERTGLFSVNGWKKVGRTGWTNLLLPSLMTVLGVGGNDQVMCVWEHLLCVWAALETFMATMAVVDRTEHSDRSLMSRWSVGLSILIWRVSNMLMDCVLCRWRLQTQQKQYLFWVILKGSYASLLKILWVTGRVARLFFRPRDTRVESRAPPFSL